MERFRPGAAFLASDSPSGPYSAVFEDDGETAYFYALDRALNGQKIVDAVLVYDLANVVIAGRESVAEIIWSPDGLRAALFINEYPHAAFDFGTRRGYCRTGFPSDPSGQDRKWDDAVVADLVSKSGEARRE